MMDCQISTMARDYYSNKSCCRDTNGNIDLWKLFNLFTGVNKTNYIDTFLDRNLGASSFIVGLQDALRSGSEHWFLG